MPEPTAAGDSVGGGGEASDEQFAQDVAQDEEDNDSEKKSFSSSSESESDSDYDSDDSYDGGGYDDVDEEEEEAEKKDDSPETNVRRFLEALDSRANRKRAAEDERRHVYHEDLFDFPRDPEKWREEDLRELWADAPVEATKPGWDPALVDEEDIEIVQSELADGRRPPMAPFYLPYRRHYPAIPDNHYDISNPKSVIEELDRIEEFLTWVSYVFEDGSTYEGTVWDDLAHGKGVYIAEDGLVRYEGEWLRNEMEGHGVVEVDIPESQPVPGSKLEAKMRAEGRIITRDFMSPEDKEWLEMDIEDTVLLSGNLREIPFYEREEWVQIFGQKPVKGRYRYAGQWKHGRMHGCGVFEVNEQPTFGRFYFGEYVNDTTGCDSEISMLHAGIAEVAAAKARMFVNKPDGMVREQRGPYGDPQHPYFYEEDDVWMAPGFIHQFYEVPDYWKVYVEEVDQEREMWLNSFYKAPLRLPMPAELEYWWSKDDSPEFVVINKEPEPDPEDPSKLIYTEDPLILHTPTGRIINYVDDEKYGVRLFWQPHLKEGEDVDPEKVEFLPLGFDEFYGRSSPSEEKEGPITRLKLAVWNTIRPHLEKLQKWAEKQKEEREMNLKLIESELDFIEAEISLEEAMEDMEMELKRKQEEEEKRSAERKDEDDSSADAGKDVVSDDLESEDEGEDEEEDEEAAPTSFGRVSQVKVDGQDTESKKESKPGKSPFSSVSLSFPVGALTSMLPAILPKWRKGKCSYCHEKLSDRKYGGSTSIHGKGNTVKFPTTRGCKVTLKAETKGPNYVTRSHGHSPVSALPRICSAHSTSRSSSLSHTLGNPSGAHNFSILSLHFPVSDSLA